MEDKKTYKYRIADQLLREQLEVAGVVVIEGPKWCGKTTTAEQQSRSILYMNDPKFMQNAELLADINLVGLLEGDTPRLIDEWQIVPKFWDTARFLVDRRGELGQFIFTGSAVPADRTNIHHTGTGRFAWVTMRTMSLWESGDSSGNCSLASLFAGTQNMCASKEVSLEDICFLICRGGWPQSLNVSDKVALKLARNYLQAVIKQEMKDVDGISRSEHTSRAILRSYARHQGTQATIGTITADLIANEDTSLNDKTIKNYIEALRKIFVVEDMMAWNPNLRSKAAIRTSDTRYFVDPSIATAALQIGPDDLMKDLNTLGLLFETLAVRDLRVYADTLEGTIYHYRDNNGLECDAVVHLPDGHYGLVEIKLGGDKLTEEGASNLNKLESKLNNKFSPSFKMVLTAVGQYAYLRKDGVWVVPISALKP